MALELKTLMEMCLVENKVAICEKIPKSPHIPQTAMSEHEQVM